MKEQDKRILRNYLRSTDRDVNRVYANPSYYKREAQDRIFNDMHKLCGSDYRIIGFNKMAFSAGFIYTDDKGNTHMRYYTQYNTRDISIDEFLKPCGIIV